MQGQQLESVVGRDPALAAHGDLVVLRESEVAGDLAGAIAKIRADAATARSRILIIGPDTGNDEVVTAAEAPLPLTGQIRRQAAAAAVVALGRELDPLSADLDQFLGEGRRELAELTEDIDEGTRARLKHRAKVLREIFDWLDQVSRDIAAEARSAAGGALPIDLTELCVELAVDREQRAPSVRIAVAPDPGERRVRLPAQPAAELLAAALALVAARIGNHGVIEVETEAQGDWLAVRMAGVGAVQPIAADELIETVKALATELGVEIRRDRVQGEAGAAMVLAFPLT